MHYNGYAYPEEDGQKGSNKLESKPGRDFNIIIIAVYDSDDVSIVVEDHSQGAEEQYTEERCLDMNQLVNNKITGVAML